MRSHLQRAEVINYDACPDRSRSGFHRSSALHKHASAILGFLAAALAAASLAASAPAGNERSHDITSAAGPAPPTSHVLHEVAPPARGTWRRHSRLDGRATLSMRVGLTQRNLERAAEFMAAVSHPSSPEYGRHWNAELVVETFAPERHRVEAVLRWLEEDGGIARGRVRLSSGRNWLAFEATAGEAEALLRTEYHVYSHAGHGARHVACEGYHLPEHMVEHVDIVTPTVHFDGRVREGRMGKRVALSGEGHAKLLLSRQDTEAGTAATATAWPVLADTQGKKEGRPGLLGKPNSGFHPKRDDMVDGSNLVLELSSCDAMITPQCLRALCSLPPGETAVGGNTLGVIEYSPQAFLQEDMDMCECCGFDGGGSKDPNVDGQYPPRVGCGTPAITNVLSTSYGYNEADLGDKYEQRQCLEYMKLGLRGVSVVFSSGDSGVAGNGNMCVDPITGAYVEGTANSTSGIFNPSFPSTCPWVTSVGAAQVLNGSTVHTPESACETSAPAFASMLTLINEKRMAAGKSAVGFVNAVLYEHPEALNDITSGKNPGRGTEGFEAVQGWDPVTGLGTPNYHKMLELFMGLP
ncbi:hypothetical protein GGTG_11758 [Gaeumannomyces tritici R3-111a-1]|uniref:Peptidase S53 domain-containing protein n=1 Tax=Gaeumannomyces tritici (strain R3-111a-1) TaxID=644352 RepID=J3PE35_GAET3|nr:hypothetical protein GGTG_11758 [Gaeumannomyces tritici R3-111a-1]EJT70735.1 hypothetical protein GGTG_11758 [Gaeumannomyces tritici R3-111a-1]